jgi:hypothetical protein
MTSKNWRGARTRPTLHDFRADVQTVHTMLESSVGENFEAMKKSCYLVRE